MATIQEAWAETSGTIADRIAQLRARKVNRPVPVPAAAVKKLWSKWGVLGACWVGTGDTNLPAGVRATLRATYDNLTLNVFTDIDMTDPAAAAEATEYLDALEWAGVLSASQRAATLALGFVQESEFSIEATDYPALHALSLITDEEAGLVAEEPGAPEAPGVT